MLDQINFQAVEDMVGPIGIEVVADTLVEETDVIVVGAIEGIDGEEMGC